jgi:hypothetical protein
MPEHFTEEKILVPWSRVLDFLKNCVVGRMLRSEYKKMFSELCGKKIENAGNKDLTHCKVFFGKGFASFLGEILGLEWGFEEFAGLQLGFFGIWQI